MSRWTKPDHRGGRWALANAASRGRSNASATFNPASLFTGGQLGAWYDPSDLTTMWQESAGTTPAAVDSPVGKINDKSGNNYHLTQATSSARPVLRKSGPLYYLEFDGVDDGLTAATGTILALFLGVSAGSLYASAATATVAAGFPPMFGWSNNALAGRIALFRDTAALVAGGRRLDADSFAEVRLAATLTADVPFIASGLFNYATATCTLRKNRAQVAQNASFQTAGSTSATNSGVAGLGTLTGTFYAGRIYGAIALQRIPTDAVSLDIENYLGAKAGA